MSDNDLVRRFDLSPAFGQADLSNCELEQIHLAGSIQPEGALIVVREPDLVVIQTSANASALLGFSSSLLDRTLFDGLEGLASSIAPHLNGSLASFPVALRCGVGDPIQEFDGLLHRTKSGGLVIELAHASPPTDLARHVEQGLKAIMTAGSLRGLCDETTRIVRGLTGYDRVMIYQFDESGHGEVVAEERLTELEAFLGNRYPASDIPQIARKLYERNRVRVLADIAYTPVPLTPVMSPLTGEHLDMSLCFLRSISPIHVQYLKNMGVAATLVVSIMVGGRLWGLISCHHYQPRSVRFEIRAVCELLAEAVATRIAGLESFAQGQAEIAVRRVEQRMIETISRNGDWRGALFDSSQAILRPLDATGAALMFEDEVLTVGEVPGTQQLRELSAWLSEQAPTPVYVASSFGLDVPRFEALIPMASGIVAVRVSDTPGEYLIWFRPERVRTVVWGGNPFKAVVIGDNPMDLSPRRSFAQWHQVVEGTCEPWSPADIAAARMIGDSVTDVVLQFRAVRTLIAQDQLEQVRGQVGRSDQPVIVGDAQGRVMLANDAFRRLLPHVEGGLKRIDELGAHCVNAAEIHRRLLELVSQRRTWRGEIGLRTGSAIRPMMVRADPVFSSPDRVLGYVVLFTDLTQRKAGDEARRRFQDGIVASHRTASGPVESQPDLLFKTLLSTIVENAQLAALEITDSADLARMPEMLESVRASVARAAEVLEHLVRHSAGNKRSG